MNMHDQFMWTTNCHSHFVCLLFMLQPFLYLVTFLMFFITCYTYNNFDEQTSILNTRYVCFDFVQKFVN